MIVDLNSIDIQELKELTETASTYIYMSFDGITISSDDLIVGDRKGSIVLKTETDYQIVKDYPYVGQRLDNYHVNHETGAYTTSQSHWIVVHVDKLENHDLDGALKEVVIAWCKKDPVI